MAFSLSLIALVLLASGWLAVTVYRALTHNSIARVRGPPSASLLLGNVTDTLYQESVGDVEFKWLRDYGGAWRLKALLGANILALADPKALQHVLQKSAYDYPKTRQLWVTLYNITGRSILWAPAGEIHARHRKVMMPAFSVPQLRSFLPLFRRSASKLSQLWKDRILAGRPGGATVEVNDWLARTTLDVIGEAAFDFDFGALDDTQNELSQAYHNMFADSQLYPSVWNMIFQALWSLMPEPLLYYIRYLPTREFKRYRSTREIMDKFSAELIKERRRDFVAGDPDKSRKDVMSVLVRANMSENPKTQLSDEEMRSQMSAMTLAGHETTANTLTWMLWELAKYPDVQDQLRAEIAQKRQDIVANGAYDFALDDFEAMPLLQAVVKETLRFHPIASYLWRVAAKDDVIPLEKPIVTETGELISEIPIAAGQVVMPSLCTYNRLAHVWGEDAHEWNPTRFLERDTEKETKVGMYANLISFCTLFLRLRDPKLTFLFLFAAAGVRSCIGWRFSVIEMQAIVVDLVENFRFAIPDDKPEIIRAPTMTMGPMVKGKMQEGFQMPLHVVPV
ncbi:cytochrome P450 [Phanerochaete sordida]|uniref:Cytochrome P450 n=1 Tax=Phanerochaete sordida TaxID=48140 RepID=A0A9P3LC83_9APHY|nr:cytochrome P450 [Phanerochaete sordida]